MSETNHEGAKTPNAWSNFKSKISEKWNHYRAWRKDHLLKAIGLEVLSAFLIFILIPILLLVSSVYFGAFGALPTKSDLLNIDHNTSSEVYSADQVLLGKYFLENRSLVGTDEVPEALMNALVATEDARFFEHRGVDTRALIRVLLRTVMMGDESGGGGSTLSQQLAKNLFPRQNHGFLTIPAVKVREMFIARRLEDTYTKEELLNLYLNTVPFGGGVYGVQAASKRYFSKSVDELSLVEGATLVGMLKANTYYNPIRNPDHALKRRNVVLSQMKKYDYLSPTEYDSLSQVPLETQYFPEGNNEGVATYFREHLRQELNEILDSLKSETGETYNLYTDGLKIFTTIDSRLQGYAEKAVNIQMTRLQEDFDKVWSKREDIVTDDLVNQYWKKSKRYNRYKSRGLASAEIENLAKAKVKMTILGTAKQQEVDTLLSPIDSVRLYLSKLQVGFLAVDHHSGAIKAWVGGTNHEYVQFDHVKAKRQVGSTFKPILYAEAVRQGIKPCEYLMDALTIYTKYDDWRPENAGGEYGGYYSMAGALAKSKNTISAHLISRTGVDSVRALAQNLGIQSDIPNVASIALGTAELPLLEMLNVYATLANNGNRNVLHYVERIETRQGKVIWEHAPHESEKVLADSTAMLVRHFMQGVMTKGSGRGALRYSLPKDVAGKTGTTQNQSDGWFIGYTPSITAGVWVGGTVPQVRFPSLSQGQGAATALPIWSIFMDQIYRKGGAKEYATGAFTPMDSLMLSKIDCEDYVLEIPMEVDENAPLPTAVQRILDRLQNKKQNSRVERERETPESRKARLEKEREKMRKRNERLQKRRERQQRRRG